MGGRGYRSYSKFSPWDSKTVDDISGFDTKVSKVARRWDGIYAEPRFIEQRHPQDFPVTPQKQVVYKNARGDESFSGDVSTIFIDGSFDSGFDESFDNGEFVTTVPII